jgi:hypothetical protein
MTLDDGERTVSAGETATVDTDVVHTFRNGTDERALVVTEIRSPGRLRHVPPTLGGLAHATRSTRSNRRSSPTSSTETPHSSGQRGSLAR